MPSPQTVSKAFDPVQAGRYGLWLLSLRSHKAALRRTAFPARVWKLSLIDRFRRVILPWRVYEYPGGAGFLSQLCGVARSTTYGWINGKSLPGKHALRLAQYLEQHASECEALALELRAYEKSRRKRPAKGKIR